jgi:ppGpp synthetase/RelA/SpoT-type nucleotidyltranferase
MDLHCEMMLEEYREARPRLEELKSQILSRLKEALQRNGIEVTTVEARVKTEQSLAGKLALKGAKYVSLSDVTDLVGARIVTLYTDDVDRIAAMTEQLFDIDWENSVDKRRLHELDSFGYNSLHYICRIPGCEYRFEVQLRTTLQHAWAAINHDNGYKSGVEIPREYMRRMNRLAGMLEMADDEFSRIRTEINDYRRRVQQLVANGKLDDVQLDGDTFRSYLQARPLDRLNKRIAAINQAEIQEVPLIHYLRVFLSFNCKTLGDVQRLIRQYEEDAYRLARHQLGNTDIDIISSAVGLQNICIVCVLTNGGGIMGLEHLFDLINGHNTQNRELAELTYEQAKNVHLWNRN